MVTADGAVRVMDFGLAALRQTLLGPNAPGASRASGPSWARRCTCRPSSCAGSPSIRAPISSASASRCTKRSTASARSRARTSPQLRAAVLEGGRAPPRCRAGSPPACARSCCAASPSSPGGASRTWRRCSRRSNRSPRSAPGWRACWASGRGAGALDLRARVRRRLAAARRAARREVRRARPQTSTAAWPTAADAARRAQIRSAFLAANVPDARERYERTSQSLDTYANAWAGMYRQNCERRAAGAGRAGGDRAAHGLPRSARRESRRARRMLSPTPTRRSFARRSPRR